MTTTIRPSPATETFLEDIRAMRRGDLVVGDDCVPLARVLKAYQAEDYARIGRRIPPWKPLYARRWIAIGAPKDIK